MSFSENTLQFLFENRVMDSKAWFEAHRQDYEALVLQPLRALVTALTPAMLEIDPLLICEPKIGKCISRIYRDTRYSKDKRLFRDVMWISFFRRRQLFGGVPGFYFELSPRGLAWGCGYYQTPPEVMATLREMILQDDPGYLQSQRLLERREDFLLEDSRYKRSRHPEAPEVKRQWLDQRSLCVTRRSEDFSLLTEENLPALLGADFAALKPFYEFLMEGEARTPGRDRQRMKS